MSHPNLLTTNSCLPYCTTTKLIIANWVKWVTENVDVILHGTVRKTTFYPLIRRARGGAVG
jgi:hypothetical protein